MVPPEGFVSTEDGGRLWFESAGSGGAVVVLPNGFHLREDFAPLAAGRTLVFYDVRNRGRSDAVTDPAMLARGIHNDVDDLEAVRRHFGLERLNLIGHSYMGLMVVLYALAHPGHVERIVQIGAIGPDPRKQYPPELSCEDDVKAEVMARLGALQKERDAHDPEDFCRRSWAILRPLYVTDPAHADRIRWDRCDLANERGFLRYWMTSLLPSIQALRLTREDLARVTAPVLTIHGAKDRSAPVGGGRDWAALLPHATLLEVEGAGHAPWVEDPARVLGAIAAALDRRDVTRSGTG